MRTKLETLRRPIQSTSERAHRFAYMHGSDMIVITPSYSESERRGWAKSGEGFRAGAQR
ncbi:hypothetical protein RHRU231_110023 [Rhodococcus ruber]|uniref:Uncharacterized protein n=1 Tax=Rhodococcus ruber TaxID=1830 RepID=A0A098BDS4_9NOCA|nr:hypothetical protein RHRU231_110023 [Rhodococcus ruber]